ncbi:MAG: MBL fold metallo-hydrolase [Candidatus Paceibacterota bacterium]|jgi:competence protein ComEC
MTKVFQIVSGLIIVNIFVYFFVFYNFTNQSALYFLDVGQGDAQLAAFGRANFLIDTGKDFSVVENLERIIPFYKNKIDLVFISHPQVDHMGGIFHLVKKYDIGVVIFNGQENENWDDLKKVLNERGIEYMVFSKGDEVIYGKNKITALWPEIYDKISKTQENDISLVIKIDSGDFTSLFTGDITSKTEKIISDFSNVDVLKVPHHGSKYSSSASFLDSVSPLVSIIEVGKNSYGHPTNEVLERLKNVGSQIFRTDLDGIVKVFYKNGFIKVSKLST